MVEYWNYSVGTRQQCFKIESGSTGLNVNQHRLLFGYLSNLNVILSSFDRFKIVEQ